MSTEDSVCMARGCDRVVWFTAERLCRQHGLKRLPKSDLQDPTSFEEDANALGGPTAGSPAPSSRKSPSITPSASSASASKE